MSYNDRKRKLDILYNEVSSCTDCIHYETATKSVFGEGLIFKEDKNIIMIVGEAPGKDEDETGRPFVGISGQLLRNSLEKFGLKDFFITNIIKHRPLNNAKPLVREIQSCIKYLDQQYDIIKPRITLAVGATAANTLLNNKLPMHELRGKWFKSLKYNNIFVTYHPAAILRDRSRKIEEQFNLDIYTFANQYRTYENN